MFPESSGKLDKSLMNAYISIHEEGIRKGHAAGSTDVQKQASQLASDVRLKAKKMKRPGVSQEELKKAYLAVLSRSPAPAPVKELAKRKLLGEDFVDESYDEPGERKYGRKYNRFRRPGPKEGRDYGGREEKKKVDFSAFQSQSYKKEKEEEKEVKEAYKPIDKEKENKMYRRAGNLARTALSSKGKKKEEAQTKSSKIVSAITKQKENKRFEEIGKSPTHNEEFELNEKYKKENKKTTKPRWQDSDGDGKWYEPGEDVKEQNQGPSTPVKYDPHMKVFAPNMGAGRVGEVRLKPAMLPQAKVGNPRTPILNKKPLQVTQVASYELDGEQLQEKPGDGYIGNTPIPNPIRLAKDAVDAYNRKQQQSVDRVNQAMPGSASMKATYFNKGPSDASRKYLGIQNSFEPEGDVIDEKKMTEGEMKKREEYVKGMKKSKKGFEQRYGKRAKEVMYATATKMAMKEAMDAVGQEDADIDNDGDTDRSDRYLHNRRKAIGKAMKKKMKEGYSDWRSDLSFNEESKK